MINWFGPASWGAPICDDCPRCEPPIGTRCLRCDRPITRDDEGITMPMMLGDGAGGAAVFHLACHCKSFLPHDRWEAAGLIPDDTDGEIVDGVFICTCCGMAYSLATRRWWRVYR